VNLFSAQVVDFLLTAKFGRRPFPAFFSENKITLATIIWMMLIFDNYAISRTSGTTGKVCPATPAVIGEYRLSEK